MTSHWIWFGAAGDSIEFSVPAPPDAAVTTSLGQEHDTRHNTASYFRRRLRGNGAVYLDVITNVDGRLGGSLGDSVQYTLEVRRFGSELPPALRPTGQRALLVAVSSRKTNKFSIVPLSLASSVRDLSTWEWFGGTYKVALVADSLYQLCRVPCGSPDTVKLTPSAKVVWRY